MTTAHIGVLQSFESYSIDLVPRCEQTTDGLGAIALPVGADRANIRRHTLTWSSGTPTQALALANLWHAVEDSTAIEWGPPPNGSTRRVLIESQPTIQRAGASFSMSITLVEY